MCIGKGKSEGKGASFEERMGQKRSTTGLCRAGREAEFQMAILRGAACLLVRGCAGPLSDDGSQYTGSSLGTP